MAERLTVSGATSQRDIDRLMELSNENQFGRNEAYYKLQLSYVDTDDYGDDMDVCVLGYDYEECPLQKVGEQE